MGEHDDEPAPAPAWVLTFSDLMSLLMTFFVMLFAMSTLRKDEKLPGLVDALHRQFGTNASVTTDEARETAATGVDASLQPPQAHAIPAGRAVRMGVPLIFGPESTALQPAQRAELKAIAHEIAGKAQRIEIRASLAPAAATANDPAARAFQLAQLVKGQLVAEGIQPGRLRVSFAERTSQELDIPIAGPTDIEITIMTLDEIVRGLQVEGRPGAIGAR